MRRRSEPNNSSEYEDFDSIATRRIATLTKISGHLKGIFSHKITQYYKPYIYFTLSAYISRDFILPLAIETHGRPLFSPGHPYIESTVLSDNNEGVSSQVHVCYTIV